MSAATVTRRFSLILLAALLFAGCATAQLDEDEQLYTGSSVSIQSDDPENEPVPRRRALERSLESRLSPQPNTSILGIRPALWIHGITASADDAGLRRWVRDRFGEPPVLFDESIPLQMAPALQDTLFNRGFFDAEVQWDVEQGNRTASVRYQIETGPAWTIRELVFPDGSADELEEAIAESLGETILETGVAYDLDTLIEERERIDRFVRERGFFAFSPSGIVFDADLDASNRTVSLTLSVEASDEARIPYHIDTIAIYADYSADEPLPEDVSREPEDGVSYFEEFPRFDPERILGALLFRPGDRYDRRLHSASISRLTSMDVFRFVNIRYQPDADTGTLHAEVLLTPLAQRNVQGEISAVQRFDGFAGPAFRVGYIDRNLTGGGERLELGFGTSLETRITGGSFRLEGYELEVDGSIRFPRSVGPLTALGLLNPYGSGSQLPRTTMDFSLRRQERFEAERIEEARIGVSYAWPGTVHVEWSPLELTVIRELETDEPGTNQFLLETSVRADRSGQAALLDTQYRLGADATAGTETLDGVTFLRVDTDSRVFVPLIGESLLAARVRAGAGAARGDDASLPLARQFVVGGSTGLRGFQPASFGPGSLPPDEDTDASGELRFEGSIEYRFGIAGWVKGAVFADAGNAWMLSGEDMIQRPSDILTQSAVNIGAGIRVDPGILVVRLDAGVPLHRPWLEAGERWNTGGWDRDDVVINLAIGYPF